MVNGKCSLEQHLGNPKEELGFHGCCYARELVGLARVSWGSCVEARNPFLAVGALMFSMRVGVSSVV